MGKMITAAVALVLAAPAAPSCIAQCGFAIVPAAQDKWYRAEGWSTPGVAEAKQFASVRFLFEGKPQTFNLPTGITFSVAVFNGQTDVQFPETVFSEGGAHKRMLQRKFLLYQLVRWEMNGKVYAYSYELGPYDVGCTASVDVVDDVGDGKFRLMIPGGHTIVGLRPGQTPQPPPVPEWLSPPAS